MLTLLIALASLVGYLIAYHTYGRWLARKVFRLDPKAIVPSIAHEDGSDFVPTSKAVVFGHHFTSIAGTGPIVGPALAVIWGWLPALLWVLFGSIFIGALHDFGSLVISLRNRGQTIGDIAGRVLSPRARLLFLSVLLMALSIVLAIFGLVIAAVFRTFPAAIFPCMIQIPLAVGIGLFLHRKGVGIFVPSILALVSMYAAVYWGSEGWLGTFNETLRGWSSITWVIVLLLYSYVASVLPVWMLLQPRDYINSLQLLSALGLVLLGLIAAAWFGGAPLLPGAERPALILAAPALRLGVEGAPWIFPFLFVTVACGAISGFHCLVSSGTSSKQLKNECDSQMVGFGSMLTEGFLAVLVILACTAGLALGAHAIPGNLQSPLLTGEDAWMARYASWGGLAGLGAKVAAFVDGSANFLKALGIKPDFAVALMGVFVASFAATTLDSACRLQRYVIQELAVASGFKALSGKYTATLLAISIALLVAAIPLPGMSWSWQHAGSGGMILWPLFGATNQLLGGLAFLVILFWMKQKGMPIWFAVVPTVFMLILPGLAMTIELFQPGGWLSQHQWHLVGIGIATLALEVWMLVEAGLAWKRLRNLP